MSRGALLGRAGMVPAEGGRARASAERVPHAGRDERPCDHPKPKGLCLIA